MKPNILNPSWKYVHSTKTDISRTFAKERKRLRDEAEKRKEQVLPIRRMG